MSRSVDPDIVTTILAPSPRQTPDDDRDPWLLIGADAVMAFPLAGQPGHGRTAFVRRQPLRIVSGRFEGGYTNMFELICPSCGDHPYLDYSEIPPRLQWLRGPRSLAASLAAYHKHLNPHTDSAAGLGPGRGGYASNESELTWPARRFLTCSSKSSLSDRETPPAVDEQRASSAAWMASALSMAAASSASVPTTIGLPDGGCSRKISPAEGPEVRYATSGDVHVAYGVVGDGPMDVVFVSGWVLSSFGVPTREEVQAFLDSEESRRGTEEWYDGRLRDLAPSTANDPATKQWWRRWVQSARKMAPLRLDPGT